MADAPASSATPAAAPASSAPPAVASKPSIEQIMRKASSDDATALQRGIGKVVLAQAVTTHLVKQVGKNPTRKYLVVRHLASGAHDGANYECRGCGRTFSRAAQLTQHHRSSSSCGDVDERLGRRDERAAHVLRPRCGQAPLQRLQEHLDLQAQARLTSCSSGFRSWMVASVKDVNTNALKMARKRRTM